MRRTQGRVRNTRRMEMDNILKIFMIKKRGNRDDICKSLAGSPFLWRYISMAGITSDNEEDAITIHWSSETPSVNVVRTIKIWRVSWGEASQTASPRLVINFWVLTNQLWGKIDLNFTRIISQGDKIIKTGYNRKCGTVVFCLTVLQKLQSPHPQVISIRLHHFGKLQISF